MLGADLGVGSGVAFYGKIDKRHSRVGVLVVVDDGEFAASCHHGSSRDALVVSECSHFFDLDVCESSLEGFRFAAQV